MGRRYGALEADAIRKDRRKRRRDCDDLQLSKRMRIMPCCPRAAARTWSSAAQLVEQSLATDTRG